VGSWDRGLGWQQRTLHLTSGQGLPTSRLRDPPLPETVMASLGTLPTSSMLRFQPKVTAGGGSVWKEWALSSQTDE
jgi:hypothetical protein